MAGTAAQQHIKMQAQLKAKKEKHTAQSAESEKQEFRGFSFGEGDSARADVIRCATRTRPVTAHASQP
eukprot:2633326-Prymnesium_polylepis.1